MLSRQKLMIWLALALFTAPAMASPIVYVVNGSQQFGTVDLNTGTFHQIGPNLPVASTGLVLKPDGSLLTLTNGGDLASINPGNGATTVIGATGLADCTSAASPCGPGSANNLAMLGATLYATDAGNSLYTVSASTGAATLIGSTGIPGFTINPLIPNPDGTFNFVASTLFGAEGSLYSTFGTLTFDPSTSPPTTTPVIAPNVYRINPNTGIATVVAPTDLNLTTAVNVNGTVYAFNALTGQAFTLDLANGKTSLATDLDPESGVIQGASPVPEPAAIALTGIGFVAILAIKRQRRARLSRLSIMDSRHIPS